jgi:hypothetical protein
MNLFITHIASNTADFPYFDIAIGDRNREYQNKENLFHRLNFHGYKNN